jgi:hypothetical protein
LKGTCIQVQVRQDKSNPASTTEQAMNMGVKSLTLENIKLSTKQQMKRMKRKKRGGGEDEDSADEEPDDAGDLGV